MKRIVIFLFAVMVINIFGEEKLKIEDFYTMKKGFVFYFEGVNDYEKVSRVRECIIENDKKIIYIDSCREDLTGELEIKERIYEEKIIIGKEELKINENEILKMPIIIGNKWKGNYYIEGFGVKNNVLFEIKSIKNDIVTVEVLWNNYKEKIELKKGVGIISQWQHIDNDYEFGFKLKKTYNKPIFTDRWYLTPREIENIDNK
jgi:hypothetical protein